MVEAVQTLWLSPRDYPVAFLTSVNDTVSDTAILPLMSKFLVLYALTQDYSLAAVQAQQSQT